MNSSTSASNRVDLMFRAFADRTRIRILHVLRDGETCVGDLVRALRIPQAKTSRHLATLRRAGLVTVREEGRWAFYSLARARDPFHRKMLACLVACFDGVAEIARDSERTRKLREGGGCCPK